MQWGETLYSARAQSHEQNEIIQKVVTQKEKKKGNDSPSLVNENSARQPWSDQSSDFEILSEDDAGAQKESKIYIFMTRLEECVGEERNEEKNV